MIALIFEQGWHWTEIEEGVFTSLLFLLLPAAIPWIKHKRKMERHMEHQTKLAEETHHLAHTGEMHPRVKARVEAGGHHTPQLPRKGKK